MTSGLKRYKGVLFFCLTVCLLTNIKVFASGRDASSSLSHYIMALMYDNLGEIDKAVGEYKQALKADYKSSVIHLNLASAYIKKNELDKAIDELKLAINFDPEAVEPHAILGLVYSIQNETELASHEYEVALQNASKLQPGNIDIYRSLGALYLKQKKFQAAENTYKLIVSLSPDDTQAYFYLAHIYDQMNNRQMAEEQLKTALRLKPDYPEALNYLGYLYVEEDKNLAEAEAMIKKALEFEPDNGAYVDSLGWFYFKKGRFKEAIKELERAMTLLEDPVIYEHLGETYFKIGDKEKAKLHWQKSLDLNPTQQGLKIKIEELGK